MKIFLFIFYLLIISGILVLCFKRNGKKAVGVEEAFVGSACANNYITPIFIFSAAFTAYSAIGLLDRIGDTAVSDVDFFTFVMANIVGMLFFAVGYGKKDSLIKKRRLSIKGLFYNKDLKKKASIAGALVLLPFLVVCVLNLEFVKGLFVNFGSGNSYLDYSVRDDRTALGGLLQAINSYFQVFFLLFPFYRCYTRKQIGILDIIILVPYFAWAFFSGDRTTLIFFVLLCAILVNERFKNFSFKFLIIAAILGVLALVMLGHLRRYNSISEMIEMIQRHGIKSLINLQSSGEFRNTTGTLLSYIKNNQSLTDFKFLGVYITELIIWIPTFIFPNRPLPLAEQYMLDFFPLAPKGTGHGWFILTDGYMAFGIIGIAIEMFIYGKLMGIVYRKFFEGKNNAVLSFLYAYFLLYVFYSVRSSMMLTIKNYIINVLPVILIYLIFKRFFDKEAKEVNDAQ